MHLADIRIHAVSLRRVYKTQVAPAGGHGQGKEGSRYYLLELVADSGQTGLGEVSDLEAGWNPPSPEALRALLLASMEGADLLRRRETWERVEADLPPTFHPELRRLLTAAVDTALLDLAGKHYRVPVCELLGGRQRDFLPVSWVAYIRGTDLLEGEIEEKVREGFSAFKMKVGGDFDLDCANVRAMRRLAGPDAYLKIDASGEWDEQQSIHCIDHLSALGADAVETPVRAAARGLAKDHPEKVNERPGEAAAALARVRRAVSIPLIEHVADFADAFALALLQERAVDIFNVVPGQSGSLHRAQRLIHLAEAGGVRVLLGSTVELGIGTAAALHLGSACKAVSASSDLVGPGLLEGDVVRPRLRYEKGALRVPRGPGLGVELDRDLLHQYREE